MADVPHLRHTVVKTISDAILQAQGREICGFLITVRHQQRFVRLANYGWGTASCVVPAHEVARMQRYMENTGGRIVAFIHSHSSSLSLSMMDEVGVNASDVPWLVVVLRGERLHYAWYPTRYDAM